MYMPWWSLLERSYNGMIIHLPLFGLESRPRSSRLANSWQSRRVSSVTSFFSASSSSTPLIRASSSHSWKEGNRRLDLAPANYDPACSPYIHNSFGLALKTHMYNDKKIALWYWEYHAWRPKSKRRHANTEQPYSRWYINIFFRLISFLQSRTQMKISKYIITQHKKQSINECNWVITSDQLSSSV